MSIIFWNFDLQILKDGLTVSIFTIVVFLILKIIQNYRKSAKKIAKNVTSSKPAQKNYPYLKRRLERTKDLVFYIA